MGDFDKMPFGKYRGFLMAHVPDRYLVWLWDNRGKSPAHGSLEFGEVLEYIEDRIDAIERNISNQNTRPKQRRTNEVF